MAKMDWGRAGRRTGSSYVRDPDEPRPLSDEEWSAAVAKAKQAIAGTRRATPPRVARYSLVCRCGHQARLFLSRAKARKTFVCSECGSRSVRPVPALY